MPLFQYLPLVKNYPRQLFFSGFHNFYSAPGQTFLISMFIPFFQTRFSLSHTEISSLYSGATLLSAFCLIWTGKWIDRMSLRTYSSTIGISLGCGLLVLSEATNGLLIFIGFFMARLFGQGLMGHIGATSVARFFEKERGQSLSLSSVGYPLSEALWPIAVASLLVKFSFEDTLSLMSLSCFVIFIPLTRVMIKRDEPFDMPPLITERSEQDRSYGQGAVLKSAFFYLSMPQTIAAPFLLTGILFFQKELGNEFGWKLGWMAAYFSLFAVSRMVAQFLVGPLIDRVGAKRVFPFISLPLCLGLFLISFVPGPSVTILFLLFCGMSVGMGGPTKGALLAEVFGVNHLGAVKSLYGMLVVLSTSASPVIFGWLIDHGITLNSIVYASGIFLLGSTLLASLAPLPKERVTY